MKIDLETETWVECKRPEMRAQNDGDICTISGYHWNKNTGVLVETKIIYNRKTYRWEYTQIVHAPTEGVK